MEGDFLPSNDPKLVKEYKTYFKAIGETFQYPLVHNGLLMNYLLFNIQHWPQDAIDQLEQTNRILAISNISKNIFLHGCEQVKEDFVSLNVENLAENLHQMVRLATKSRPIFEIRKEIRSNTDIDIWVNQLIHLFKQVKSSLTPDASLVDIVISIRQGDFRKFQDFNEGCTNLFFKQYITFMNKALYLSSRKEIPVQSLSVENFNLARLLKANEQEFHHTSLKDQLESFLGSKNIREFASLENMSPWSIILTTNSSNLASEYVRHGHFLAKFLKREDIFVLLLLFLLFQNSNSDEIKKFHSFILKALITRLQAFPEFKEWPTPQDALKGLFKSLHSFGEVLQDFLKHGNQSAFTVQ